MMLDKVKHREYTVWTHTRCAVELRGPAIDASELAATPHLVAGQDAGVYAVTRARTGGSRTLIFYTEQQAHAFVNSHKGKGSTEFIVEIHGPASLVDKSPAEQAYALPPSLIHFFDCSLDPTSPNFAPFPVMWDDEEHLENWADICSMVQDPDNGFEQSPEFVKHAATLSIAAIQNGVRSTHMLVDEEHGVGANGAERDRVDVAGDIAFSEDATLTAGVNSPFKGSSTSGSASERARTATSAQPLPLPLAHPQPTPTVVPAPTPSPSRPTSTAQQSNPDAQKAKSTSGPALPAYITKFAKGKIGMKPEALKGVAKDEVAIRSRYFAGLVPLPGNGLTAVGAAFNLASYDNYLNRLNPGSYTVSFRTSGSAVTRLAVFGTYDAVCRVNLFEAVKWDWAHVEKPKVVPAVLKIG